MEVQFHRIGERRYALKVLHKDRPPVEFGGPGYDPLMPHDLLHFIVERELGMTRGIFGFIAAGGDARGPERAAGESRRQASRRRRHADRRDAKMLRRGARDEGDRSERATFVCAWEWWRRSGDPARGRRIARFTSAANPRDLLPADENEALSERAVTRICAAMDELSAQWSRLAVGQFFSVEWPERLSRAL
jgi:hypothetical protein